jgi:hypothetical protein
MAMKKLLLAGVTALLMVTSAAHADDIDVCLVVRKTPDGFLALREKATIKSKVIATLRTKFPLFAANNDQFLEGEEYRLYKNWTRWTYVKAWIYEETHPAKGWAYNRYIKKIRCTPAAEEDDSGNIRPESLQ